jgi:dipeptidyl aminopeptidase/acylaminoacyl peptidase
MQNRRPRPLFLLLTGILFSFAAVAEAQNFTLEQVMSSPFPSDLTVSKRGDKLAWAFDAEGKRNIWVAEGPAFTARQVTRSNDDDGQELSDLVFSPNGSAIAYVRGQGKNQSGEVPNPTSDPAGAKQQVLVADTRTGRVTTIGEGNSPFFNPTGDQVIYLRDGKFWTAPAIGGKERKLFEIRGTVNSPQWSPGGTELAFVSNRGDHSFIGIYDTRSNYIRFKSPSVDRDVAPRWSPDGKRIAFIRLFNISDTFSMDRERLQPWAIQVADRVGDAKQIWKSPVLLIHGDDDRNVEFSQTVNLVRLLRKNGVYFEQIIWPDEIHDFLRHQDWVWSFSAAGTFFDKHLK